MAYIEFLYPSDDIMGRGSVIPSDQRSPDRVAHISINFGAGHLHLHLPDWQA